MCVPGASSGSSASLRCMDRSLGWTLAREFYPLFTRGSLPRSPFYPVHPLHIRASRDGRVFARAAPAAPRRARREASTQRCVRSYIPLPCPLVSRASVTTAFRHSPCRMCTIHSERGALTSKRPGDAAQRGSRGAARALRRKDSKRACRGSSTQRTTIGRG